MVHEAMASRIAIPDTRMLETGPYLKSVDLRNHVAESGVTARHANISCSKIKSLIN